MCLGTRIRHPLRNKLNEFRWYLHWFDVCFREGKLLRKLRKSPSFLGHEQHDSSHRWDWIYSNTKQTHHSCREVKTTIFMNDNRLTCTWTGWLQQICTRQSIWLATEIYKVAPQRLRKSRSTGERIFSITRKWRPFLLWMFCCMIFIGSENYSRGRRGSLINK